MSSIAAKAQAATEPAWAARFRAPAILLSQIAIDAPGIGLVSTNASGEPQLYRWDTATGELTQLTFEPTGRMVGHLSPDGRWVAWLDDQAGNEIGRWVDAFRNAVNGH